MHYFSVDRQICGSILHRIGDAATYLSKNSTCFHRQLTVTLSELQKYLL